MADSFILRRSRGLPACCEPPLPDCDQPQPRLTQITILVCVPGVSGVPAPALPATAAAGKGDTILAGAIPGSEARESSERKHGMDSQELRRRFATLTTAHLADACIRAQIPVRCAPALLRAVVPRSRVAGRVSPAQHVGSVDIFLEALERAAPGDVLTVDNGGRLDESCVGDLVALEAQGAGLEGIVIWGLHRDTADIQAIGLPVFSLGTIPTGPQRLDERPSDALESATVGDWTVSREDVVLGDDDGVLFVPAARAEDIFTVAETIRDTERRQAARIRAGVSLRSQVQFDTKHPPRPKRSTLSDHASPLG